MFYESDTFPFRFMLETCIHFDFWNKILFEFFKGDYDVGYFSYKKSKCTHVSSINLKGKVSDSKNIVTALTYFCSYPCGTPCTFQNIGNFFKISVKL